MKTYLSRAPIRILAFAVIFAMVVGLLPAIPREASAATTPGNPRIGDNDVTWDCVYFGRYPQSSDGNGDYKEEKIKWRVLSVNGDEALLLADKNLDAKPYNVNKIGTTWKTSTIRSWLNGYGRNVNKDGIDYTSENFINKAFTEGERELINQKKIQNRKNPYHNTNGGDDTMDKVFLLSLDQVMNPAYGFPSDPDEYAKARRAMNTEYAKSQGAYTNTSTEYKGNGSWWLRSPGSLSAYAAVVDFYGRVFYSGYLVDGDSNAIRPALYLNLESSLWAYAGTVSSDGKVEETGDDQGNEGNLDETTTYPYTISLDKWLSSEGTDNSIKYLTSNENFICSVAVAKSDASFANCFMKAMTNMIYQGVDSWKDIFALATTREQAQEVIVALLDSQGEEVQELADAQTARKYAKAYVDTLKESNWAYAMDYGLSSSEIDKLAGLCTEDKITDFFMKGKYEEPAEWLKAEGGYSDDSPVVRCIKQFSESKELAESLSDGLGLLGDGLQILAMTEKTMRNVYDVERLASADEMFSEMLLYLRDHSIFIPVKGAAGDLYDVIHGGYLRQLDYATTELQNAATDKAVDLVLEGAAKALPYGEVIKESFDFAGGVSTIVFNTGNTQKQKDNMRCVAYIGECLSEWLLDNKGKYSSQSGQDKEICAKKTMYAYYMLLKTRMAGEESLQKMMELSKPTWKKAYTLSLEASSILRSNEEWLKSDGVLSHICTSVIACPVDVEIRDASGKLIQTVHDGTPVEGYVKDIYYCVAYQPLDQDYVKIIRFPSDKGYTLKCIGTGLGTVDYSLTTIAENGINTRKESKSIPVKKGSTVEISGMSENKPDCVLREDGKTIEYQVNIADEYIAAQSLQCKEKNVALTEGEKKRIDVVISPINASIQEVAWTSSALSVATVNADGVVTALGQGETTIQAKTVDGGFTAQCKVIVGEKTINQNPPTSNGSHSPNMANNQSDKTEISTAKVKKPKKVTLKKAKSIKRGALKLTWKRDKKVTGYQAVVATDKKFKKNKKSAFITKNKTVTKTFTKLKRKKAYFAKVRAYKKVGKTKVYGAYSKVKKVKVR